MDWRLIVLVVAILWMALLLWWGYRMIVGSFAKSRENMLNDQKRRELTAEIMAELKEKRANGDISEEQYEEMVRKIFGEL